MGRLRLYGAYVIAVFVAFVAMPLGLPVSIAAFGTAWLIAVVIEMVQRYGIEKWIGY